ncbi:MAG: PKD domain-containing protein [Thermoplasmata archaeon]
MSRRVISALLTAGILLVSSLLFVGAAGPTAPGSPGDLLSVGDSAAFATPAASVVVVAPGFSPGTGVRDLGPVPHSTLFDVAVGVAPQNPSGLTAYLAALYVPGSPAYHHFLSDATLSKEFGATPASLASVVDYFESYGLRATVSPDRLLVTVEGTAADLGPAFGTSFQEYGALSGVDFVSHSSPAELPADLAVTGVLGLGNATPILPSVAGTAPLEPIGGPDATCSGNAGGPYSPCQIQTAYDMTGTLDNGTDGAGVTIAVVDAYDGTQTQDQLESDLASFDSGFQLPTPSVQYLYPVASDHDLNTSDTGWGDEEALDLEWSHASAPGAAIDMTFSPNPGAGLYEAVDYLVAHQVVDVISLSWGEPDVGVYNSYSGPCSSACNASTDGSYAILGPVLEFAAAEGISVFAASGDCGGADGTNGLSTNFPASDPYVTGVGGTVLSAAADGTYAGETGWSGSASGSRSPGCQNQGGSGGGFAPFPQPWWQQGEGVPSGSAYRGVPDVSAVSMPGVEFYYAGGFSSVAGTSLATPIWAGIAALADQYSGTPLGLLNPSLYSVLRNATSYADAFHDVVSGNNTYGAGAGWDPVTGIGSPIVGGLLPELMASPRALSSLEVALHVSATSGRAPLNVSFTVSATNGSGSYPLEGVYFGDGTAGLAVDGAASHTYTTAGVFAAQAYAVDRSGNTSTSVPTALVVGGGSALAVNLTASSLDPSVGSEVDLTASATGGTGPDSFEYSFGDGTFLNWTGAASVEHAYAVRGSFCAEVVVRDSGSPPAGGSSRPVGIAVGTATSPTCGPPDLPLVVSANSSAQARDAPADFPALFGVSGGSGTTTEQYRSSDPYVAACNCAIFPSSGTGPEPVWLYVNDSAGQRAVAETNVTVEPPLAALLATSRPYGPAPWTVVFTASVSGGDAANAADTEWTFGDGGTATGASVRETYPDPGMYWALGQLSDGGEGNASEAFLVDVSGPGAPAPDYLRATVDPAVDVPSGGTVDFSAGGWSPIGVPTSANFTWTVGGAVDSYSGEFNRTFYAPALGAATFSVSGQVSAEFAALGDNLSAPLQLAPFFAVEPGGFVPASDALTLADTPGPASGLPPLAWSATASATGPGSPTFSWTFGDGGLSTGGNVSHSYTTPGNFTAGVRATDGWGDVAVDSHGVSVVNDSGPPLGLDCSASRESGTAPLLVDFTAQASGGTGTPYRYDWQFGDGADGSSADVNHTYGTAGVYRAIVTALDSDGASIERNVSIVVSAPSTAAAPLLDGVSMAGLVLLVGLVVGAVAGVVLGRTPGPGRRTPSP